MNKTVTYIIAGIGILILGFLFLNTYIYNEKQGDGGSSDFAGYFEDRMTTFAVEDIGQPIEGFDASLLVMAFPSLVATDFAGVETLEGHYELENGEIIFVRDERQPVSTVERTISQEGYATLLENLSARLSFPVYSEEDVIALIALIDTGERVMTKIDQGASALGVTVIPQEVLEDSRCPIDVECIQAGTVRVRATLESGLGTANQVFELDQPITTEAEQVTLVSVAPAPESEVELEEGDYIFYFEIVKR